MGSRCSYKQGPGKWDYEALLGRAEGRLQFAEPISSLNHLLLIHTHQVCPVVSPTETKMPHLIIRQGIPELFYQKFEKEPAGPQTNPNPYAKGKKKALGLQIEKMKLQSTFLSVGVNDMAEIFFERFSGPFNSSMIPVACSIQLLDLHSSHKAFNSFIIACHHREHCHVTHL